MFFSFISLATFVNQLKDYISKQKGISMKYFNNIQDYEHATGELPYNMTNNYMFIAVLQEDKFALRGLVASLLHRDPEEITDIFILNPIELGVDIDLKDYILDLVLTVPRRTEFLSDCNLPTD